MYGCGDDFLEGQIAIPKAVRDRLNLQAGTAVVSMEGMVPGDESLTKALLEEREVENAYCDARIRQDRRFVGMVG